MEDFLKFNTTYSTNQENLIAQEFSRLKGGTCYLDHTGATLYSEKQLQNVFCDASQNIYSNPHAGSLTSKSTKDAIDIIRYKILEHFNTTCEEYSVIFTASATAALKTIGECFNYGKKGTLVYLENNHTSVLGMRSYAANSTEIKTELAFQTLSPPSKHCDVTNDDTNNLFVYPAQSNFSGSKYPLNWINKVKDGALNSILEEKCTHWYVTLDCASYVSMNSLDLTKYKPDFIPVSFYKMFGYPTGLGALLVKKTSEDLLIKKYFGGGTVLLALSSKNVMIPRNNIQERFEDGTLPFLSILAIKHGFDTLKRLNLNFDVISKHTFSLAQYVYRNLLVMHHCNGRPAVILYHDTVFDNRNHQGGIINFNLLRPNGDYIGFSEVLQMSNLHEISIRTGCFCNPGACQRFLELSTRDVLRHFDAGHVCGDQHDLVDNYPTGSVRISFGYMSTKADADKFLKMIENCFVSKPTIRKLPSNWYSIQNKYKQLYFQSPGTEDIVNGTKKDYSINTSDISNINIKNYVNGNAIGTLQYVFLYPIKSCGAYQAKNSWPLTPKGLKYDREWMITGPNGVCLTQKHNKNLCLIKPEIDLKLKILRLKFKGQDEFELSLTDPCSEEDVHYLCQSKVCGDMIQGWDCGDRVSDWLSQNLDMPGLRLLQQCNSDETSGRILKNDNTSQLSLANKAQYLMVNSKSVDWLIQKVPDGELIEDQYSVIQRFRPNFVVSFQQHFQEHEYDSFLFDSIIFKSAGKCTRCQMVCINQESGKITKEPLLTLSREFKGKTSFGVYLNQDLTEEENIVSVGCNVIGRNTGID